MRQQALDKLINKNTSLVSLFSATKLLNKRDITEWTHIVKEMPLIELITLGYAKHIQ
jgi:hypothetical protein